VTLDISNSVGNPYQDSKTWTRFTVYIGTLKTHST